MMGLSRDELFEQSYTILYNLAMSKFRNEVEAGHSLHPTALVNESYYRLASMDNFKDKKHGFRTVARMMQRILVDHARQKKTKKRGWGCKRLDYTDPELKDYFFELDKAEQEDLMVEELVGQLDEDSVRGMVIRFRHYMSWSKKRISKELGITLKEVDDHLEAGEAWLRANWPKRDE